MTMIDTTPSRRSVLAGLGGMAFCIAVGNDGVRIQTLGFLERFVVRWQTIVRVNQRRSHIASRTIAIEERRDFFVRRGWVLLNNSFANREPLAARRN